jgi:hypothetical protein
MRDVLWFFAFFAALYGSTDLALVLFLFGLAVGDEEEERRRERRRRSSTWMGPL